MDFDSERRRTYRLGCAVLIVYFAFLTAIIGLAVAGWYYQQ